jgi:hypothetical protein
MPNGNPQVTAPYPIPGGQTVTTPTCGLSSYNGWLTFKADNHNAAFKSPAQASTCLLSVSRQDPGGAYLLDNTEFTVRAYPLLPQGPAVCSTPTAGNQKSRQFSAPANTLFQFALYLVNANGSNYQLSVAFQT